MIVQCFCNSYKNELFLGIHSYEHEYRMALFTSSAELNKDITTYTGLEGEVEDGNGYTTGGKIIENIAVSLYNNTAIIDSDDIIWESSSITARGGLIYNNTLPGKNAVAVFDFGEDYTSINGDFKLVLPEPTDESAILRIT